MNLKLFLAKWQKQIQWIVTLACLMGSGVVLSVGYALFHDRMRTFWIFTFYMVVLTGVAIFFARRLIAMIADA